MGKYYGTCKIFNLHLTYTLYPNLYLRTHNATCRNYLCPRAFGIVISAINIPDFIDEPTHVHLKALGTAHLTPAAWRTS